MKKLCLIAMCVCLLAGCKRYSPAPEVDGLTAEVQEESQETQTGEDQSEAMEEVAEQDVIHITNGPELPVRTPVKVKGIYVSAYVAGTKAMMDNILAQIEGTEVNALVIDVKNDDGRITFAMDSPVVEEIGACKQYIPDIKSLIDELKERNIYVIARVVAFKDPYLAEKKPEWSLKKADGSLYRDKDGLAWVNPYRQEVWDYLVDIGAKAYEAGFDEIQFDYIRFATDKTMRDVAFDEAETKGRSKTDIITEFTQYACEKLTPLGVFVAADVFGAIIGSQEDADSVGQIYADMAKNLDYICPMIYPSHYGDGNFGIQYPDKQPYETILAALTKSREDLAGKENEDGTQAVVRPWLQDFTASYLKNYIKYGPEQVRAQIQAVYDNGYDEWILWNASCKYSWGGLLSVEEAAKEAVELESKAVEREIREAEARESQEAAERESKENAARESEEVAAQKSRITETSE